MANQFENYIKDLMRRREAIQARYDALLLEPQSYSISGSLSATNQRLEELRKELVAIDAQIASALGMGTGGIVRKYPRYVRW